MPAFGPGSLDYTRRKAEQLEIDGTLEEDNESNENTPPSGSYAGAGSYF
jgi:hypothetical protein